jgi:hypothetical protein
MTAISRHSNICAWVPTLRFISASSYNDAQGDAARLTAARRHARVDGVATECGMARGDPARLPSLLAAHICAAQLGV